MPIRAHILIGTALASAGLLLAACSPDVQQVPSPAPSVASSPNTIEAPPTKAAPVLEGTKVSIETTDDAAKDPNPADNQKNLAGRNYYGAIALAYYDGAVGYSYNYSTATRALNAAQRACKRYSRRDSSCHRIAWVRNGCLALAVKWRNGQPVRYGWAARYGKTSAKKAAVRVCGSGCKLRAWTCTTR